MKKITESNRIAALEQVRGVPLPELLRMWHWQENLKHSEIGSRLGVPRPTITRWFRQFGVPTQLSPRFTIANLETARLRRAANKKPKIKKEFRLKWNTSFFEAWSPGMAYVLGYLFADGYVWTNRRGSCYIGFTSTDRELIEKVRNALGSNHKISARKAKKAQWKTKYVLQIGSKSAVRYLERFGIIQNKSLCIRFPDLLPEHYLGDFVRGYFDGDGCISLGMYQPKDRASPRNSISCRFTSGSLLFLEGLRERLQRYTNGGFIVRKNRGYELVYSHRDTLALYELMYNNGASSGLLLTRKYHKFQAAIRRMRGTCALSPHSEKESKRKPFVLSPRLRA